MSFFLSRNGFNPNKYTEGSQVHRIISVLRDFKVVPLPFFLRMEPRIATHTSIISQLRKKGFVIKNFERVVKIRVSTSIGIPKESHQVHSFYELLYDPETGYSKDSEEETYVQQ